MRDIERFSTSNSNLYRGSVGVFLVYDIANRATFDSLSARIKYILELASNQVNLVLVGNKCDLVAQREVSFEEGR